MKSTYEVLKDWAIKEQKKSTNKWLKSPIGSTEGRFHLMRSEIMREVAKKIKREIKKI